MFVVSSWLNEVPQLPPGAFVFGALFAMHSHLLGQLMDYDPDRKAGRRTTVVFIGVIPSKWLLAGILIAEAWIAQASFAQPAVTAFLAFGSGGFALHAIVRKNRLFTLFEMRALFFGWNAAALGSLWWIWSQGVFVAGPPSSAL